MIMNKNKELRIALLVFFLGFGMMNILWLCYSLSGNVTKPGLYDYYAATIGDGICLPIMAYSGLSYIYNCQTTRYKYIELITGIISVFFSIGMQISWLLDDKIKTNWTIPRVHYFNLAGWYHAVFFVFMITFTVNLIVRMYSIPSLDSVNQCKKENLLMYAIFWISASLFLYMHSIDDYVKIYGIFKSFSPIFLLSLSISILLWIKSTKAIHTSIIVLCLGQIISLILAISIFCCTT